MIKVKEVITSTRLTKRIVLLAILSVMLNDGFSQQSQPTRIIAYFSGRIAQLDSIDVHKITDLIFCFGHLDGHRFKIDNARDTAIIHKMVSLKEKNPALKVMLSLGGWGGCETCSDAFFTKKGRETFALSVKEVCDYFGADGIDMDWEYPTVRLDNDIDQNPVHKTAPEDKKNFTDLMKRLRRVLGPDAILSFAAGGFNTYLQKAVEWKKLMRMVDHVNLMSYDLINGYATETGHHTALYATPRQVESTDNAVRYLIDKAGVPPGKIIIGAAFYARLWENVPGENNGLYQTGKFWRAINYKRFPQLLSPETGYSFFWDEVAKAPYAYNSDENKFATFDDKRSVQLKSEYVLENKLGGIMFWEISLDTQQDGLLHTIHEVIRKK